MSESIQPKDPLTDSSWPEEPAARLWQCWRQGLVPDLRQFLADVGALTPAQLVAVLRVDQRERWQIGQRTSASSYLNEYPAVRDDAEAAHELIYGEFLLREEMGECPTLIDYVDAYPQHASRLRMQVGLHRALGAGPSEATACTAVLGSDVATDPRLTRESEASSEWLQTWRPRFVPPVEAGAVFPHSRFQRLFLHARGGLGQVFVAVDRELRREVALKEIADDHADDAACRARFVHEAEVTGGLEHPGIVAVYGLGHQPNGRPYYAMRLIRGESLQQAIDALYKRNAPHSSSRRPRELRRLLGRFVSVCNAIAYAHSRGVLHRDIKPANIMLGPFGETLVVDWGLAKVIGRGVKPQGSETGLPRPVTAYADAPTEPGSALGTPSYMSPEQAEGCDQKVGPASDVYSLGATLYHILTGQAPLANRSLADVLMSVKRGDIPTPQSVHPNVSRSLEAVCLKAMALRPEDRYASPRALAEDVELWLSDEPVLAFQEPWITQVRRWMSRHRPLVAATTAAALVVSLATSAYVGQRLANAHRRVDALKTAETRSLPLIIGELGADRHFVRDRLRRMARGDDGQSVRLPAALALLPDDRAHTDYLASLVLDPETSPDMVLVIRDALIEHGHALQAAERWRRALPPGVVELTDAQLRAAGGVTGAFPNDSLFAALIAPIAHKLSNENSLHLDAWREVFQPIADRLVEPLRRIYSDAVAIGARRHAFTLLFEFATRPGHTALPEDLAALVADADSAQMRQLLSRLDFEGTRERAVAALERQIKDPARFDENLARRQGRVAIALLQLDSADLVWPLFRHRDDPSVRTELIHNLSIYGFDPAEIASHLQIEPDASTRRALMQCLGEFEAGGIAEPVRKSLSTLLIRWYRDDPDPGIHESVRWLLSKKWGLTNELAEIERALAGPALPKGRNWYVNGEGQTFSIVRGPVDFSMGSTLESDPDRDPDETPHHRRIDRSFAIAAREVTFAEYSRFLDDKPAGVADRRGHPQTLQDIPTPDCAAGVITWYEAASYCNWLSEKEGIPADEWCFPKSIVPGMRLPEDYLRRTGYRLPTEAEWEFACRAGSTSSYLYGSSEMWLTRYGWFDLNSHQRMQPVGRLKPNDLGLQDVVGNAIEWCADFHDYYAASADGAAVLDALTDVPLSDDADRSLRGGGFYSPASHLRSALRNADRPSLTLTYIGVRLARTVPTADGE